MSALVSPNTQAILLLSAPLVAGRGAAKGEMLTPGEYKRLARQLRELNRQPADLLAADAPELLHACAAIVDDDRLRRLLSRGFLLSQAIERWQARAIWVVSRADAPYPRRLKTRLREDAPIVLYGCGDIGLLDSGGLAVVGSRHVDEALTDYATAIGRLCARAGRTVVSGGARGIDRAAMSGAAEDGGKVVGVLSDSLEKSALNRENRNLLLGGQLVLVSPYDPNAGFNVGHAMQRNKSIYALADAALVVSADLGKGGTWAGASEQLDKYRCVPVFVRSTGETGEGLQALAQRGALQWPNPDDAETLNGILHSPIAPGVKSHFEQERFGTTSAVHETVQPLHPASTRGSPTVEMIAEDSSKPLVTTTFPAWDESLGISQRVLQDLLSSARSEREVATALHVNTMQARSLLTRLVHEGVLVKTRKPARYVLRRADLFD